MTLSSSAFPAFPGPTVAIDFNRLILGPDGAPPADVVGMEGHAAALEARLSHEAVWSSARSRLAVAHSFGGMLLLHWLVGRAEGGRLPIGGMVLISTTAGPMYDAVRLRIATVGRHDIRIPFAPWLRVWNHPVVTRLVKRAFTGGRLDAQPVDFRQLVKRTDAAVDAAGWRNTDWRAMRSYRLAMQGFDVRDRLARIDIPTVVLHGTRDSLFPLEVGRALANRLPNARFQEVTGAGHALPLTHGAAVLEALREIESRQ